MTKYNSCSKEFQDEAKRLGLTGYKYTQKLREEGKLVDTTKVKREKENKKAQKKGYKNLHEYSKAMYHRHNYIPVYKYNPCSKEFQKEANILGLTGSQYIKKLREEEKLVNPTEARGNTDNKKDRKKGHKDIKECNRDIPVYKHNPCSKEFQEEAKRLGLTGFQYICSIRQNGALKSPAEIDNNWAKKRGYKNYVDYCNHLAQEKGFENLNDYRNHFAQERGFKNISDYRSHLVQEKGYKSLSDYCDQMAKEKGYEGKYEEFLSKRGFKNDKEYRDDLARGKGFRNNKDYRDCLSQKQGYESFSEYQKTLKWDKETCFPMFENEDCSLYLGVHITEKKIAKIVLQMIFERVEKMPNNNPGFDFICKNPRQEFLSKYPQFKLETSKEYKIDIKSATVDSLDKLQFAIRHNDIPDYFLSVGFNNRDNLDISGIWLIKSDEQIRINRNFWSRADLWDRKTFTITNRQKYLLGFQKYELVCKLKCLEKIRDEINE